MRAMTFLWIFLAAAAGIGVLLLKHNVEALEIQLQATNDAIMDDQQAVHVLKAEWSYLNDPVRLRQLAESHLSLAPMRPDQITTFADLPQAPPGERTAYELPGDAAAAPPNPQADGTAAPRHLPPKSTMTQINQVEPPQGGLSAFIDQMEAQQ